MKFVHQLALLVIGLAAGLAAADIWEEVEHGYADNDGDTTIVAVPGAGHFVQQDAAELITETMRWWLLARKN